MLARPSRPGNAEAVKRCNNARWAHTFLQKAHCGGARPQPAVHRGKRQEQQHIGESSTSRLTPPSRRSLVCRRGGGRPTPPRLACRPWPLPYLPPRPSWAGGSDPLLLYPALFRPAAIVAASACATHGVLWLCAGNDHICVYPRWRVGIFSGEVRLVAAIGRARSRDRIAVGKTRGGLLAGLRLAVPD